MLLGEGYGHLSLFALNGLKIKIRDKVCEVTMQKVSKLDVPVSCPPALLPLLQVSFSVFPCS